MIQAYAPTYPAFLGTTYMALGASENAFYFAGRLVGRASAGASWMLGAVSTDGIGMARWDNSLGGVEAWFYPWGEERGTVTANDRVKFATYRRDSESSLDYAGNRYYSSVTGRFMSPDPYMANSGGAGDVSDPQSWNRYAYTRGDPVNRFDPWGLDDCAPGDFGSACDGFIPGDPGGGGSGDGWGVSMWWVLVGIGEGGGGGGGGGGGKVKCPEPYQGWINAYGAAANATGLSEANVLALSAIESGWGGGRFASQGNDFFNLETVWKHGTPIPGPKYAYQTGWLQAKEMFTSGPSKGGYALVATYNSASDSFNSLAATLGTYFQGVTDPATFGGIAVAHGEYGGRGAAFVTTAQTFINCLK